MLIRIWRFLTLVLTALLAGMTFCHVLEMPAKLQYSASMYLALHRTLYVAFGPPNIGVFVLCSSTWFAAAPVSGRR